MGQLTDPALVELSADATWPAQENEPLGPWRLRATRGYSHRANSVRTVGDEDDGPAHVSWLELIAEAEAFYRQRNLPAIFHISPATAPRDLDRLLDERGYNLGHSAEVWSADPGEVREIVGMVRYIAGTEIPKIWPWVVVPLRVEAAVSEVGGSWANMRVIEE